MAAIALTRGLRGLEVRGSGGGLARALKEQGFLTPSGRPTPSTIAGLGMVGGVLVVGGTDAELDPLGFILGVLEGMQSPAEGVTVLDCANPVEKDFPRWAGPTVNACLSGQAIAGSPEMPVNPSAGTYHKGSRYDVSLGGVPFTRWRSNYLYQVQEGGITGPIVNTVGRDVNLSGQVAGTSTVTRGEASGATYGAPPMAGARSRAWDAPQIEAVAVIRTSARGRISVRTGVPVTPFPPYTETPLPPLPIPPVTEVITPQVGNPTAAAAIFRIRSHSQSATAHPQVQEAKRHFSIGGVPMRIFGMATEALDFFDMLHEALPEEYQAKGHYIRERGEYLRPRTDLRIRAVVDHFDQIDWERFAGVYVDNYVEELLYGTLGNVTKQINQLAALPFGLGYSPGYDSQSDQIEGTIVNAVMQELRDGGLLPERISLPRNKLNL